VIGHVHLLHESDGGGKPVTPKQAVAISLGGLGVGIAAVALACTFFLVPFGEAMIYFGIGVLYLPAFLWASLSQKGRRGAIRAHNGFVYFMMAVLVLLLILEWGKEGKPFQRWAAYALIAAGVAAYSVMAYYAVVNFWRWRHGDFNR
jgi:hypothetical protein